MVRYLARFVVAMRFIIGLLNLRCDGLPTKGIGQLVEVKYLF
jgi:hypothetical protein